MTHPTLKALLTARGGAQFVDGERVYGVTGSDGKEQFVVAKSPKAAAEVVVTPRLVQKTELLEAAFACLNEQQKESK